MDFSRFVQEVFLSEKLFLHEQKSLRRIIDIQDNENEHHTVLVSAEEEGFPPAALPPFRPAFGANAPLAPLLPSLLRSSSLGVRIPST